MSQFETIRSNLVNVQELNHLTEKNNESFAERLETLKACWQDNAGQSFYQRQCSTTIHHKELLNVSINSFLSLAASYLDNLQHVEKKMLEINTEYNVYESTKNTIESVIEDVKLIQQSTAALELDINNLHNQSRNYINSV